MSNNEIISINDEMYQRKKIKYSEEVNLYIKSNIDNKNYAKLLEENPKEILASMDKMKFTTMEVYLFNNTAPSGRGDDIKISKVQLNNQ